MKPKSQDSILFDAAEVAVLKESIQVLNARAPNDCHALQQQIQQLQMLNRVILQSPSLSKEEDFGGRIRSSRSLVDHLTQTDGLSGDLDLPIKANLQRTYLLAKIQIFRGFVTSISNLEDAGHCKLLQELRDELAQSIYTQMAEDLLLALLRKPSVELHTKRRAARQLIRIWDNSTVEIDDFCPLLESAWRARNRVNPGLGSLLGTTEYFRLVAEDCSDDFLDFFAREGVSEAENEAFAEFLFGLTWEELQSLRKRMKRDGIQVVDECWASQILEREIEKECDDGNNIDPIALYRSYTRRQLASDYRILAGTDGPRRTAESYLMIYLLDHEKDLATVVDWEVG